MALLSRLNKGVYTVIADFERKEIRAPSGAVLLSRDEIDNLSEDDAVALVERKAALIMQSSAAKFEKMGERNIRLDTRADY